MFWVFVKDLNVLTGWVLFYRKHLFLGKKMHSVPILPILTEEMLLRSYKNSCYWTIHANSAPISCLFLFKKDPDWRERFRLELLKVDLQDVGREISAIRPPCKVSFHLQPLWRCRSAAHVDIFANSDLWCKSSISSCSKTWTRWLFLRPSRALMSVSWTGRGGGLYCRELLRLPCLLS